MMTLRRQKSVRVVFDEADRKQQIDVVHPESSRWEISTRTCRRR
jgi:hypothetical protein